MEYINLQPEDEEYQKIKKSILDFDLVEPFIVNKRTGNLISGYQRLKILKEYDKEFYIKKDLRLL